jgi:hypothetical protein
MILEIESLTTTPTNKFIFVVLLQLALQTSFSIEHWVKVWTTAQK